MVAGIPLTHHNDRAAVDSPPPPSSTPVPLTFPPPVPLYPSPATITTSTKVIHSTCTIPSRSPKKVQFEGLSRTATRHALPVRNWIQPPVGYTWIWILRDSISRSDMDLDPSPIWIWIQIQAPRGRPGPWTLGHGRPSGQPHRNTATRFAAAAAAAAGTQHNTRQWRHRPAATQFSRQGSFRPGSMPSVVSGPSKRQLRNIPIS